MITRKLRFFYWVLSDGPNWAEMLCLNTGGMLNNLPLPTGSSWTLSCIVGFWHWHIPTFIIFDIFPPWWEYAGKPSSSLSCYHYQLIHLSCIAFLAHWLSLLTSSQGQGGEYFIKTPPLSSFSSSLLQNGLMINKAIHEIVYTIIT